MGASKELLESPPMGTPPHIEEWRLARHEAAHAVMFYWFGWWLGKEGVSIIADEDSAGRAHPNLHPEDYTVRATIITSLAGPVSEGDYPSDADLESLCAMYDYQSVVHPLWATTPNPTAKRLVARIHSFEEETLRLLQYPPIANSIEAVADELLRKKTLSDGEVLELLRPEVLSATGRIGDEDDDAGASANHSGEGGRNGPKESESEAAWRSDLLRLWTDGEREWRVRVLPTLAGSVELTADPTKANLFNHAADP